MERYKELMMERLSLDIDTMIEKEVRVAVEKYELKIENLKKKLKDATVIRKSECGNFINLSDFCRVQRDFLEINEDNFKQYMFTKKFLTRNEDGKYVPVGNFDVVRIIDGDLYINNKYARQMLLMRSMIFVGDDDTLNNMLELFQADKERIIHQISSTVYVDYRQNSYEFRALEGNVYSK